MKSRGTLNIVFFLCHIVLYFVAGMSIYGLVEVTDMVKTKEDIIITHLLCHHNDIIPDCMKLLQPQKVA